MQDEKFKNTNNAGAYEGGMKALSKSLQMSFLVLLLVIVFMLVRFISFGGYFAVKAQEAVIVLQFGKFKEVYTRDWHWFLPYPVNRFIHIKTSPEYMTIAFASREAMLMPGAPVPPLEIGRDGYMLSADGNILHSNWKIGYRVNDARKFYENVLSNGDVSAEDETVKEGDVVLGLRGPRTMLKNIFQRAVIQVSAAYNVGDIYDTKRSVYADAVKSLFTRMVNDADLGIVVDDVVGLRTKDMLYAWQYLAYNPITRKGGRMKDYKKTCTLIEYTQDYEQIRRWTLDGCFVTGIDEADFDRENDGKRQISVEFVFDRATMEIPEAMIDTQARQLVDEFAQRIQAQGLSFEQYLQFTGMNLDTALEQMKPNAVKRIQSRLVLEAIVKAENIEVSDEDVKAEIAKMAETYKMDADKLAEIMSEEEKKQIQMDMAIEKAVELVTEAAKEV